MVTVANATTTDSLADSLPTIINSARIVREFEGVMPQLVDRVTLPEGRGLNWDEVSLAQLTAQAITETTVLDNPQQIVDTNFQITPTVIGIQTLITDRVRKRISRNAFGKIGSLAQNAMERKKDDDGLTVLDGATTSLSGTGTTLVSGIVTAGKVRISGNTTEPGMPPYRCVLHPFQMKDIHDEIVAPVGTYDISAGGLTARVFAQGFEGGGFEGTISSVGMFEDGNITISSNDAKGGVFAKEAIVLVQGFAPRTAPVRREDLGAGADVLYMYDEYAYGERSAGNWLFEILSDATAPTS